MQFWTAYMILGLGWVESAFSAGNGGHGSPSDLIAPLVNVVLLGGFLIWKLKKPLSDYFTKQAGEVSNTLERASLKSKEAEVMLAAQEKKMANLDNEVRDVHRMTENDLKNYEKLVARETEEKSSKLKADANGKIEAEKRAISQELHMALLDEVIAKTKGTIKGNKEYQNKASSRLVGELR